MISDIEYEEFLSSFKEILTWTNDDNNIINFEDFEFEDFKFKDFEKENLNWKSINETPEQEFDEIIDNLKQIKFTSCVIIDFINSKFQQYKEIGKLR